MARRTAQRDGTGVARSLYAAHYSRREVAASRIIKRTRGQRCERTKGRRAVGLRRGRVKSRMLEDELEAETSRSVLEKGGEGGGRRGIHIRTHGVFRRTPRR